MAKELFGANYKDRILDLNASDERGIAVVRDKIKEFSQKAIVKLKESKADFQIIILDEADSMTKDAQSALRRIIEDHTQTTRFCIICNYVSRIIDPIASRLAKFKFAPLSKESQIERLKFISAKENCNFPEFVYERLQVVSGGDLRKSINLLQSLSKIQGIQITEEIFDDVCGVIPNEIVNKTYDSCKNPTISTDNYKPMVDELLAMGYDLRQFLIQLTDKLAEDRNISDNKRHLASQLLVETDIKLNTNSNSEINYYGFFADLISVFKEVE
ncbi:MAG: AAA family ATPase [archaeon]|nr:AAA family ATPase [archaeon]